MDPTDIFVSRKELTTRSFRLTPGITSIIHVTNPRDVVAVHIGGVAAGSPGIGAVLMALARALAHSADHPGVGVCIATHSRIADAAEKNSAIAYQRALPIYHFLAGHEADWIDCCRQYSEWMSFDSLFQWLAENRGIACQPMECADGPAAALQQALAQFRGHLSAPVAGPFGPDDWRQVYSAFSAFIAESISMSPSELDTLRSSLEFFDPPILVCGDQQPVPPPTAANEQERVDVLFFAPGDRPSLKTNPPGASFYGVRSFKASDSKPPQPNPIKAPDPANGYFYVVKSGDYLDKIAREHGLSGWKPLYDLSQNKEYRSSHPDPNKLRVGDKIWVPGSPTGASSLDNEGYPLLYSYKLARANGVSEAERSRRPAVAYAQHKLNIFLINYDTAGAGLAAGGVPSGLGDEADPYDPDATKAYRAKVPPLLDPDQFFGDDTENAVKALQACMGLEVDGKIGPITWDWLDDQTLSLSTFGPAAITTGFATTTPGFFGFPWPAILSPFPAPFPMLADLTFTPTPLPGAAITPHMAIEQIFDPDRIKQWKVGCALFVQLAHLRAKLKIMGSNDFDQHIQLAYDPSDPGLMLKLHESTSIGQRAYYERLVNRAKPVPPATEGKITGPMNNLMWDKNGATYDVSKALKDARVGSRVCWMNPHPSAYGTEYLYENTIKLGPDRYAAHGFVSHLSRKNQFSEKALRERMCAAVSVSDVNAKEVFLYAIEIYDSPSSSGFRAWLEKTVEDLIEIGFGANLVYDRSFWEEHLPPTAKPPSWLRMKDTFDPPTTI